MSESPHPLSSAPRTAWPMIALIAVVALVWISVLAKPFLEKALGLGSNGPFFDLRLLVVANEAASHGMNPYVPNLLDTYQRPFLYSSWWLWPGLGLTRASTVPLGIALVAATLFACLAVWRVRSGREAVVAGLVLVSPAWLLAVFRANNDLVIFLLLVVATWALSRTHRAGRVAAAVLIGVMTILKYYPAAVVVGLLRAARRREVLVLLVISAAVIALGWPSLGPAFEAIARYGFQVTASVGLQAFGIKVLGQSLAPYLPGAVAWIVGLVALLSGYQLAKSTWPAELTRETEDRLTTAALGGAMLLGCWVIGTSFSYKLVFVWPLLPWLVRDAPATLGRGRAAQLLGILIFTCWADGLAATFINTLGPGWSRDARMQALNFSHAFSVLTQLTYWLIMGAALRLVVDWSRRQRARLETSP